MNHTQGSKKKILKKARLILFSALLTFGLLAGASTQFFALENQPTDETESAQIMIDTSDEASLPSSSTNSAIIITPSSQLVSDSIPVSSETASRLPETNTDNETSEQEESTQQADNNTDIQPFFDSEGDVGFANQHQLRFIVGDNTSTHFVLDADVFAGPFPETGGDRYLGWYTLENATAIENAAQNIVNVVNSDFNTDMETLIALYNEYEDLLSHAFDFSQSILASYDLYPVYDQRGALFSAQAGTRAITPADLPVYKVTNIDSLTNALASAGQAGSGILFISTADMGSATLTLDGPQTLHGNIRIGTDTHTATLFQPKNKGRHFNVLNGDSTLTLDSIVLQGGGKGSVGSEFTANPSGGIYASGSVLTLIMNEQSAIVDCVSAINSVGGALDGGSNTTAAPGSFVVSGGSIRNSHAYSGGGAAYLVSGKSTFTNTSIEDCTAGVPQEASSGGAIYTNENTNTLPNSSLTLVDTNINGSIANTLGGSIANKSHSFSINLFGNTTISNSNSKQDAGAIFSKSGVTMGEDTEISDSHAKGSGGAIFSLDKITMNGKIFNCSSEIDGGAIYIGIEKNSAKTASIDFGNSGTIYDCHSVNLGGAIVANSENPNDHLTITGGEINGCTVKNGNQVTFGGAIYSTIGATITGTKFYDCEAIAGWGGAIFSSGNTLLTAVTIDNCSAEVGGAVYSSSDLVPHFIPPDGIVTEEDIKPDKQFVLDNCELTNNHTVKTGYPFNAHGGAIYADNMYVTVKNGTTISSSHADGDGGAIYCAGVVTISDSTITGNTSENSGGGLAVIAHYTNVTTPSTIINSEVSANNAMANSSKTPGGGGVYTESPFALKGNTQITDNHTYNGPYRSSGGGVLALDLTTLTAESTVTFSGNTAPKAYAQQSLTDARKTLHATNILISPPNTSIAGNPYFYNGYDIGMKAIFVTFNANGGRFSNYANTTMVQIDENDLLEDYIPYTLRNGFVLSGWSLDQAGIPLWNLATDRVNGEITLYAQWTPAHLVTFWPNNGQSPTSWEVVSGETTTPPTVSNSNLTFEGWYTENSFKNKWNFATPITEEMNFYAKWPTEKFQVIFDSKGGSLVATQEVRAGEKASIPTPAPTKSGYDFSGWYIEPSFLNKWNFNDTVNNNLTLHAKWTATPVANFNVTFNSNGGTPIATQNIPSGGLVKLPTPAPTKTGFIFEGWYKDIALTIQWNFANDKIVNNTTLYARWRALSTYTVTFNGNGATQQANPASITITEPATTLAVLPNNPARTGYTFEGWNTKQDGSGQSFSISTSITNDMEVFAQWNQIKNAPSAPPSTPVPSAPTSTPASSAVSSLPVVSQSASTAPSIASSGSVAASTASSAPATQASIPATVSPPQGTTTAGNQQTAQRREATLSTITESGTPVFQVGDTQVPLFGPSSLFVWSLFNLLAAVLAGIFAIITIASVLVRRRKNNALSNKEVILKAVSTIASIVSILVFLLTSDLSGVMTLFDGWSAFIAVLLVVQLVSLLFSKKRKTYPIV